MRSSGILHPAMYDIMQEWYKYIEDNVHIQADLIGMWIGAVFYANIN